jgi:hypothetical protein
VGLEERKWECLEDIGRDFSDNDSLELVYAK